jgi:hypothetical protein
MALIAGASIARRHPLGYGYTFTGGYPTGDTVRNAYDDADLIRAVQAYRFFFPTVSGAAIFKGNSEAGIVDNKVFGVLDSKPRHVGFTYNSDTPYGPVQLDLRDGPFVIELPPGRSSSRRLTSISAGLATWACRVRTVAPAANTSSSRPATRGRFRQIITYGGRARTA